MSYPRPVEDKEALAAAGGLMGVVATITLAASLGPMAGFEGMAGGAEVAGTDFGMAAGGGVEMTPEQLEL